MAPAAESTCTVGWNRHRKCWHYTVTGPIYHFGDLQTRGLPKGWPGNLAVAPTGETAISAVRDQLRTAAASELRIDPEKIAFECP